LKAVTRHSHGTLDSMQQWQHWATEYVYHMRDPKEALLFLQGVDRELEAIVVAGWRSEMTLRAEGSTPTFGNRRAIRPEQWMAGFLRGRGSRDNQTAGLWK
jgi:hypothetical protein